MKLREHASLHVQSSPRWIGWDSGTEPEVPFVRERRLTWSNPVEQRRTPCKDTGAMTTERRHTKTTTTQHHTCAVHIVRITDNTVAASISGNAVVAASRRRRSSGRGAAQRLRMADNWVGQIQAAASDEDLLSCGTTRRRHARELQRPRRAT